MHLSQLTEIAILMVAALLGGITLTKLKQPAVLGYLLAGFVLGPSFLGLFENRNAIEILAELGVLMLLFLVGLELDLKTFREKWKVTVGSVFLQIMASVSVMLLMKFFFDWSFQKAILLGFVISLSSTAVSIKMLEETGELKTDTGRLALGVLIAQDLAFVPMILFLRSFEVVANSSSSTFFSGLTIVLSFIFLAFLVWYLGGREKTLKLPFVKQLKNSGDLAPLSGMAFCFGLAALAGVIGITAAYGAFVAGIILGNSAIKEKLIKTAHPIQSILVMIFFLSIGLLLDLTFIWDNIGKIFILLFLMTIFKTFLNISIFHLFKISWHQAFLCGVMLAQIGELSFLLATMGMDVGIIDLEGKKLVITLTALSLAFSPIWLTTVRRLKEIPLAYRRRKLSLREAIDHVYAPEMSRVRESYATVKDHLQTPSVNKEGKKPSLQKEASKKKVD